MSTAIKPKSKKKPFIEKGEANPGKKFSEIVTKPLNPLPLEEIRKNASKKRAV